MENLSARLEQGSDVWIISVEWKSLNANFKLSFLIILSVLDWLLYFLNDGNLIFWGFSDWNNFGWFLLFFFFRLLNHLGSFFSLDDWLDLFAGWLFAFFLLLLFDNNWLLNWRFGSLLDWLLWSFFFWFFGLRFNWLFLLLCLLKRWFSGLLKWRFGDLLHWLNFLFTFFFRWLLDFFSDCFSDSLDWSDNFLWSLNLLLFRAFLTFRLNFFLWDNSLLSWRLGLHNFLWSLFFTFLLWRFLFFGFLWSSILCFNSFDCLFLNLLWFLIHWNLWGLSSWLNGFGFGHRGFFFFTGFLNLGFLFGLFFGVNLLFLWNDQGEWAWWVFFGILW